MYYHHINNKRVAITHYKKVHTIWWDHHDDNAIWSKFTVYHDDMIIMMMSVGGGSGWLSTGVVVGGRLADQGEL